MIFCEDPTGRNFGRQEVDWAGVLRDTGRHHGSECSIEVGGFAFRNRPRGAGGDGGACRNAACAGRQDVIYGVLEGLGADGMTAYGDSLNVAQSCGRFCDDHPSRAAILG